MAHQEQRVFIESVKNAHSDFFTSKTVTEFGSLYINGTVRDFFTDCEYVGVDLFNGACVDVISKAMDYKQEYKSDVVISCEMLEHDNTWIQSLQNMVDCLESGGLMILSCATTGRAEHGTSITTPQDSPFTNDYYQNLTETDIRTALDIESIFETFEFTVNETSHDLYFWGVKK